MSINFDKLHTQILCWRGFPYIDAFFQKTNYNFNADFDRRSKKQQPAVPPGGKTSNNHISSAQRWHWDNQITLWPDIGIYESSRLRYIHWDVKLNNYRSRAAILVMHSSGVGTSSSFIPCPFRPRPRSWQQHKHVRLHERSFNSPRLVSHQIQNTSLSSETQRQRGWTKLLQNGIKWLWTWIFQIESHKP